MAEFKTLATNYDPQGLKVKDQFDAYLPLYGRVDEALKKINKSVFTAQLQEADKARDEMCIGIAEINKACLRHFDQNVREAAARLQIVFDTYGNIAKKPLNEQTSAVYNILQELRGRYLGDTDKVGIKAWVVELEKRNKAFDVLMKERFDESALKCDIVLKTARAELDDVYRMITERIDAFVVIEGPLEYEQFVKTLNAIVAKYVSLLNRRGRKGDGGGEENSGTEGENV